MRALIAEDDRGTAAILSKVLSRWNMDIDVAFDGDTAWSKLTTVPGPSFAMIDWMMPGIDGLELCRRIRQNASLAHIHVILLTGRDSRADVIAGLEAGADDYVVKPFDPEELRARVQVGIRVLSLQERLAERVTELQSARDELARLASTDALTGLFSRGHWLEMAVAEFGRYRRYNRPLSVLMADLDLFKNINDTFGHDAGDQVLKRFTEALRLNCRTVDLAGRLGGEEFAVLLPETPCAAAQEVARRIVESCRALPTSTPAGHVAFSCSIGVAEASKIDHTIDDVMRRADQALYEAKRSGRNCSKAIRVRVEKLENAEGLVP